MDSPHKSLPGIERIWRAVGYSAAGLRSAYIHEAAFRQELWLALVLVTAAMVLPLGLLARASLIGAVLLVLIVELINSAIEAIVDRVSLEHHELSKRAKDIGSAAVMLSLGNCLLVWILVLADAYV